MQKGGHIIDPRTAQAVKGKIATWSSALDATTADALSTAFMIMDVDEITQYCSKHTDALAMIIFDDEGEKRSKQKIMRFGPWEAILDL